MPEFIAPECVSRNIKDKPAISSDVAERRKFGGLMDRLIDVSLRDTNIHDPEYKLDKDLIRRQRRILHGLNPKITEELQAHLQAVHIEEGTPFDEFKMLKGEVFERLLEAEEEQYGLFPKPSM